MSVCNVFVLFFYSDRCDLYTCYVLCVMCYVLIDAAWLEYFKMYAVDDMMV